jgi:hypothetical protein
MTAPFRDFDSATYVGVESSFATLPTMYRAFPITGSFEPTIEQTELEVNDESIYLDDYKDPVLGFKSGGCKLSYYVRPSSDQLSSGGGGGVATIPLYNFFTALFGINGTSAGAGSTTASVNTTVDATLADASSINEGQWVLPTVSGTTEPCRVGTKSTNTLTWDLGPSTTPTASSAACLGMYNWFPANNNTSSLYVQYAVANESTNEKYSFSGCTGDMALKFDRNGLLQVDFDLKANNWSCPSSDTIAVTVGTDTMGTPFALKDATVILQSASTTTRTQKEIVSFSAKLNMGMVHNQALNGTAGTLGANGNIGVMRTSGRMFAEATVRLYGDTTDTATYLSYWTSRTALQFVVMIPSGSGSTKRWFVFDMPKCIVVGRPKPVSDGGRRMIELTLRSKKRSVSASGAQGRSSFTMAIG